MFNIDHIQIRKAVLSDVEGIYKIESEAAQHTFYSSNKATVTIEAVTDLISTLSEPYPFLVATVGRGADECIIGFAYASPFSPRVAFSHSCIIYLRMAPHFIFSNASQLLLDSLESELKKATIIQMLVSLVSTNDTYRNFLLENDFNEVGQLPQVDYQASQWHDVTWMMKTLIPAV